jgi:hypothetical protein
VLSAPDSFILHLQSRELAPRTEVQDQRQGRGDEHQGAEPSAQVSQPGAAAPEARESAAHPAQGRQRGGDDPHHATQRSGRHDHELHQLAADGEPDAIRVDLDQSVRGGDERLHEAREGAQQAALRPGRLCVRFLLRPLRRALVRDSQGLFLAVRLSDCVAR